MKAIRNNDLNEQIALVTGASRGIGRAIAVQLAQQGCHVVINYRNDEAGAAQTAAAISELGREALLVPADVSSYAACENMVAAALDKFGRLDVLVNNAGITRDNLLVSLEPEDILSVINTNLLGVIYPTKAVAMQMMRQRYGRIVNLSSSAASKPGKGQSNYAAAKGGVEAFTKAMAVELAPRNILVNAVAPGVIVTEMSEQIRELGEEEIKARLLLKRYAEADEVADLVCWLASPANQYMTGEVLHLDGGLKMA
ncbi:3-oxoacyl-ACP reductase family protein [Cellvibrio mixtus]|uniref:3-oxoacyl-ACP reductase family protein n=1 Tax=Cellvibrio mixtus TaxID=39650 RepID=UPI000586DC53|nr:3-oxoacyl-ACP reductase family protein [Cellvibrio mixtus]